MYACDGKKIPCFLAGVLLLLGGVQGCTKKMPSTPNAPSSPSYVEQKLADASELIQADLAILRSLTCQKDLPREEKGSLARKIDLIWDGPIEGAIKSLAAATTDYRFIRTGNQIYPSTQVHVHAKNQSCLAILRELCAQKSDKERIIVDEQEKTITLHSM